MHRAPTTVMPSQVVHAADRKNQWYSLAKWQIVSTLIATNLESPKHHKMKATFVPKSSQQLTLVTKVSLSGEEKQQWRHVPCTIDVGTCRGSPVQALCNSWFESFLSHKSKCPMWHPTQWSTLLGHWMCPNDNATWQSRWPWLPQELWCVNTRTRLLPHCN